MLFLCTQKYKVYGKSTDFGMAEMLVFGRSGGDSMQNIQDKTLLFTATLRTVTRTRKLAKLCEVVNVIDIGYI
jgi:hypothetical protein